MMLNDDAPFVGVLIGAIIVIAVVALCLFVVGCAPPGHFPLGLN